jgi:hypothetical protein
LRHKLIAVLCASALSAVTLSGAVPIKIVHTALSCFKRAQNPVLTVRIEGAPETERIYFRAVEASCGEYYVDMRKNDKDPTVFWAVLPLVRPETNFITYQIRASRAGGPDFVSPWVTAPVMAVCSVDPLTAQELSAAANITVGLTSSKQTGKSCGFRCDGMTWSVSSANVLAPNAACQAEMAGRPWYRSPDAIAVGAGALLGGVLLENNRQSNPPSPARP